jgi:UDP-glucose:(heptosyl)LPS alpha-1,3-glucosyltransferase
VAVSQGLAEELAAGLHAETSIDVVPNGVDTTLFSPDPRRRALARRDLGLEEDVLLALFVGGEWQRKGLALALEAVGKTTAWRLAIVGDGDQTAFELLADRLGIESRVTFLGRRADVADLYRAADVLLAPSAYETFSLVVHEAAASGVPVVATSVHGVDELLADGAGGRLVPRDATAIANALEELADSNRRAQMGAAARAGAEKHDWSSAIDAYESLYHAAGQSHPAPADARSAVAT